MKSVFSVILLAIVVLLANQAFAASYQLAPVEDAWTYALTPDSQLGLDQGIATTIQNMSPKGYAYLKFTLPDLTNETIQSATLNLYQFIGGGYGEGPTALCLFSNNSWSESTITWNNAPSGTLTFLAANADGGSYRGWSDWSFSWNPNLGSTFTLFLTENSSGDQGHGWYSKDYSDDAALHPYLEISTVPTNPVPVPASFLLLLSGLAGLAATKRKLR